MNAPDGMIDQYKRELSELLTKLEKESDKKRVVGALKWPFTKKEVASFVDKIYGYEKSINAALQVTQT